MIRLTTGPLTLGLVAISLAACSPKPAAPAADAKPAATSDLAKRFKLDFTVAEMMTNVVDFTADGIWLHQGWDIDAKGEHELFPKTDAEWDQVAKSSAVLAEAANALMVPGRAVDDTSWPKLATNLHMDAMESYRAAKAKDKEAFFKAGSDIFESCRDCHQKFILGEEPPERIRK